MIRPGLTRRSFLKGSCLCGLQLVAIPGVWGTLKAQADPFSVDRANPLVQDRAGRAVHLYTELNVKNAGQENPHWAVVSRDGRLKDRAIFRAYCDALAFHDALVAVGCRPGNNLTEEKTGEYVAGDELIVYATWPGLGHSVPLGEVLSDTSGKGFRFRFGGNRAAADKERTGCITCLESCWVGITSNGAYPNISPFKRFLSPNSHFKTKAGVVPAQDGYPVILTYQVGRL